MIYSIYQNNMLNINQDFLFTPLIYNLVHTCSLWTMLHIIENVCCITLNFYDFCIIVIKCFDIWGSLLADIT